MAKLKHIREGQVFLIDLEEEYTILGRSRACDLTVPGVSDISREHCCIRRKEGKEYTIKDLGSTNGTFVNGDRLKAEVELKDGDRIRLGKTAAFTFLTAERFAVGEEDTSSELAKTITFGTDTALGEQFKDMEGELKEKSYHSLMEDLVKATRKKPRR